MAQSFLRKIILEELQNVLKEEEGLGSALSYSTKSSSGLKGMGDLPSTTAPGKGDINIGAKGKNWARSLFPEGASFVYTPTLQNTKKHAKKVLSAINGESIIPGYKPCGDNIIGLRKGCMGKGVLKLQSFVKSAIDNIQMAQKGPTVQPEIDGYFGPRTEAAINSFLALAGQPKMVGAFSKDLHFVIEPAVPRNFDQAYDRAYASLVRDYVKSQADIATSGVDAALSKSAKAKTPTTEPGDLLPTQQISPETPEEKEKREKARKDVRKKGILPVFKKYLDQDD